MSDGKTAVLTRKSPLEKFASFCGSAAAWLAALVLFGLAAASLIARMARLCGWGSRCLNCCCLWC